MDLRIDRPCARQTRLLLRRQRDPDFAGDGSRHLALQGQHVTQVTLVTLRPDDVSSRPLIRLAVIRTLSPARTTEPSMIASTCSSRAMVGTGFRAVLYCMTDVREITRSAADLGEVGNELLGHPVGEVLLVRVAGQILERQHRDRSNLAAGGAVDERWNASVVTSHAASPAIAATRTAAIHLHAGRERRAHGRLHRSRHTRFSSRNTSPAVCHRSSGSLARQRRTMSSRAGGTSGCK